MLKQAPQSKANSDMSISPSLSINLNNISNESKKSKPSNISNESKKSKQSNISNELKVEARSQKSYLSDNSTESSSGSVSLSNCDSNERLKNTVKVQHEEEKFESTCESSLIIDTFFDICYSSYNEFIQTSSF